MSILENTVDSLVEVYRRISHRLFDKRDVEIIVIDPSRVVYKRYLKNKQLLKVNDTGKSVNVKLINL
jgi:hypothetical protein